MTYHRPNALVETEWLADNLTKVVVLDGSWYLPKQKRNAKKEYIESHICGAQFFDIDVIADQESFLPHMLPKEKEFSIAAGNMGISNSDHIIVYDGSGLQSAARVWWTFRAFGHEKISVLNGGFPKWKSENYPVENTTAKRKKTNYIGILSPHLVRSFDQILKNIDTNHEQLLDARSSKRFYGTEPEPRSNLRSGHIPKSRNLPYTELLDIKDQTLIDGSKLRDCFRSAGINLDKPVITSCGSGITAAILALSLHLLGHSEYSVYDGSWAEWGANADTPIESQIGKI